MQLADRLAMRTPTMRLRAVAFLVVLGCGPSDQPQVVTRTPEAAPPTIPATEDRAPPPATLEATPATPEASSKPLQPFDMVVARVGIDGFCSIPASSCPEICAPVVGARFDEARQCVASVVVGCQSPYGGHNGTFGCRKLGDGTKVFGPIDMLSKFGPDWTGCGEATTDSSIRPCER